eukprot:5564693-Pleurochrysis_carterae.AAC.2
MRRICMDLPARAQTHGQSHEPDCIENGALSDSDFRKTAQVHSMIEEVAVLSGHENDGKLSFRDYMGCIQCVPHTFSNRAIRLCWTRT